MNENKYILTATNLVKCFSKNNENLTILDNINLQVIDGQSVAIEGASGSGKTTLMHILSGLDKFTSGEVQLNGINLFLVSDKEITKFRNKYMGFVYQSHCLIPELTALENVALVQIIGGINKKIAHNNAKKLLSKVGLKSRLDHLPGNLSGGERQRVSIARALINKPKIIFADEPTGNLDFNNAEKVMDIFLEMQKKTRTTLVIVTHDRQIAKRLDVRYNLYQGKLEALKNVIEASH